VIWNPKENLHESSCVYKAVHNKNVFFCVAQKQTTEQHEGKNKTEYSFLAKYGIQLYKVHSSASCSDAVRE